MGRPPGRRHIDPLLSSLGNDKKVVRFLCNVVGIERALARVIGVREKLAEGYESRHLHVAPLWRCTRSRDRVSPKHGNACRALVRRPRPWSRQRLGTRSLPPQTLRLRAFVICQSVRKPCDKCSRIRTRLVGTVD
jgi:hypothetical protein